MNVYTTSIIIGWGDMMGCMCTKCKKCLTFSLLGLGVLFLLRDLGVWNFWNVSWWTALLLLGGVKGFATGHCKDCQVLNAPSKKKK